MVIPCSYPDSCSLSFLLPAYFSLLFGILFYLISCSPQFTKNLFILRRSVACFSSRHRILEIFPFTTSLTHWVKTYLNIHTPVIKIGTIIFQHPTRNYADSLPIAMTAAPRHPISSDSLPRQRNASIAVRLTAPPGGPEEDLHFQVCAPCRAHIKQNPSLFKRTGLVFLGQLALSNCITTYNKYKSHSVICQIGKNKTKTFFL